MRRYLTCHVVVFLLCAAPVFAQARAKAQNVPEIPYESVPNFLKLPPNLYLGEAIGVATNSKGHVFVYTRSANTRLFEFDQAGTFVREIGEGNYGFEFAHAVRVDPQDNIWVVDEGTNMVIKFNPEGRVVMVLGRRPEAVAGVLATQGGPAPPAEKYLLGRPTDVAWDPQGNIFVSDGYVNHRVVKYRQGRPLHPAGRQRAGRSGAEPVQHAARHRRGRAGQRLRVRPRQQPHAGVRQQPGAQGDLRQHRRVRGPSASRRVRISICSARTRIPTATPRAHGTSPARSTRWSWTARSSAASATRASSSGAFRSCTRSTAATRTRSSSRRSSRGACRS